ncbi:MAG: alpha/beta hydrolase [Ruminococcus sp.]|nr:alpha/beta hydrolase [Ruminococcus sp.]
MNTGFMIGAAVGGAALLATGVSVYGAHKLFNSTIPRQDQSRVSTSEVGDDEKWQGYRKMIGAAKEWLMAQPLEPVSVQSRDGLCLKGHYLASAQPGKRVLLALHGYTSNGIGNFCTMTKFYQDLGFDCLIVDHRAHGESEGDYVGFGILDRFDCLEWIRYTIDRFGEDVQILLHGVSMGAATALMVLGFEDLPVQVKGAVADCGFTSPYDVFAHVVKRDYHMSPFPMMTISDSICKKKAGYRCKDYSTLTAMETNTRPVLFIHGDEDSFVPTWMTEQNYEACKAPKEKLIVKHAGHAASYYENHEAYEAAVSAFVAQHMPE